MESFERAAAEGLAAWERSTTRQQQAIRPRVGADTLVLAGVIVLASRALADMAAPGFTRAREARHCKLVVARNVPLTCIESGTLICRILVGRHNAATPHLFALLA